MKKQRTDGQETRQRLLEAAAEVFAKKGFWETTNADICKRAGANTAAVNYHFGSKDNLYVEAWKYVFERSVRKHPPDGGVSPDAPVEERLRGRILAFMQRVGDPETSDLEITHKEMANPTGLLTETIRKCVKPLDDKVSVVIQEILGESASDVEVQFCQMSILSQCFGSMLRRRHAKMSPDIPAPDDFPETIDVKMIADHIILFSLAGLRAVRERSEMKHQTDKGPRQE